MCPHTAIYVCYHTCRIPLYYEAKLIFVLWLALPQTRGALVLWQKYKNEIGEAFNRSASATALPLRELLLHISLTHTRN